MAEVKHRVSPAAVGWAFFKLGMSTYGGAASAAIGDEVVRRRGWLNYDEFMTFRSIAMIAPGPNSPALAVLLGRYLAGPLGALLAWMSASLPGVVVIVIFGMVALNPHAGLSAALRGCAAAAVGLTVANAIEMTYESRRDRLRLALMTIVALAVVLGHLSLWLTFAIFVPVAMLAQRAITGRT